MRARRAADEVRIDLPVARRRLAGLVVAAAAFIALIVWTLGTGIGPFGASVLVFGVPAPMPACDGAAGSCRA